MLGTRSQGELRALLAEELVTALKPGLDRSLQMRPGPHGPAVIMVVGVNGTGKTTTCGKLARVLASGSGRRPSAGPRVATRPAWPSTR